MSTEANKTLIRRQFALISNKDLEAAFALISPDVLDHAAQPGTPPGLEGVRQFFTMLITAFPDLAATVEDVLAEGDRVSARITVRGTHTGPFLGIPPTGKPATLSVMDMYRIADGKIAEHWGLTDQVS